MTGNIRLNSKTINRSFTYNKRATVYEILVPTVSHIAKKASVLGKKARFVKNEIKTEFIRTAEILADKTAREGLFGEDAGKGFCGTDVDYIPEDARELYINRNICGMSEREKAEYAAKIQRRRDAGISSKDSRSCGIPRCFNGF